jgi:hypothetical protein
VPHILAILLGAIAATRVGLIGHQHLVHQRLVVFAAKQRRKRRDDCFLALLIDQLEFHLCPRLDCRTHNHIRPLGAGNCALEQQQLAIHIDANNFEILLRALDGTQVTRHFLARENPTRILRHAG